MARCSEHVHAGHGHLPVLVTSTLPPLQRHFIRFKEPGTMMALGPMVGRSASELDGSP